MLSVPLAVIESADVNEIASARDSALVIVSLEPYWKNSTFDGIGSLAPSGGRSRLMLGTGTGIGIFFVTGSNTVSTVIFLLNPSRPKVSDSTLVCASMLTLSAR